MNPSRYYFRNNLHRTPPGDHIQGTSLQGDNIKETPSRDSYPRTRFTGPPPRNTHQGTQSRGPLPVNPLQKNHHGTTCRMPFPATPSSVPTQGDPLQGKLSKVLPPGDTIQGTPSRGSPIGDTMQWVPSREPAVSAPVHGNHLWLPHLGSNLHGPPLEDLIQPTPPR